MVDLSNFYDFTDDHYMLFHYVGQNAFHITVYMDDISESRVNRYLDEIEREGTVEHWSV